MLKYLQNLHTHTVYCDGADTPEEIVVEAINKGFSSIGFSGHSYMYFSDYGNISVENTELCRNEVEKLKAKYSDKLEIFNGLEVDIFSKIDLCGYDYLIGSVHYLEKDNEIFAMDRNAEDVKTLIETRFDGNGMEYAKKYYKTLAKLPDYGKFDIIGHFDLLTKHSDNVKFFDEESKEYRYAAVEAAECLAGKIPFFEVNTGAIARGYRKTPYPSEFLLRELKRLGFGVVISSDCHDRKKLDCGYKDAEELLIRCGFKEYYILTQSGFIPVEF